LPNIKLHVAQHPTYNSSTATLVSASAALVEFLLQHFKLRLFWCKIISGNDFTPHHVFGCAWKKKFPEKHFI